MSLPTEAVEYELTHDPDGTSWTARENLADILSRELLGPMYGDDEAIKVSPETAYPLGRIAPRRLIAAQSEAAEPDEPAKGGESAAGRGVPVPGVDDTTADSDEDAAEDTGPKRGLMIPASMGLRFQIPTDLTEFRITASWGTYQAHNADQEPDETGRRRREYLRTQHDVARLIDVSSLTPGITTTMELDGSTVLRIDVHPHRDQLLVEVALCNDREVEGKIPTNAWLFQTKLYVDANGLDAFLPVSDHLLEDLRHPSDVELNRLNLQYRDRLEFAIGRTCSVDWTVEKGARRATKVWTTWLPVSETPQTRAHSNEAVTTDMKKLATASVEELSKGLMPIVTGYEMWLGHREKEARELPPHLQPDADEVITEARQVAQRLREGITYLITHDDALQCFRFMNTVMADQRIHTEITGRRAKNQDLTAEEAAAQVDSEGARHHSWRMFQLAFVLMQIPALCEPANPLRSDPTLAHVELLFFPTGGGKTEAYLGLAAFAFAIRRLQGVVESADGPFDGRAGVTVLMRYTLRLLTAQQFQRASTMVCAAELARMADPGRWGDEPFRIGLWVGTTVSPKRVKEAHEQLVASKDSGYDHGLTVLQIKRCPWCGTPITKDNIQIDTDASRVHTYCGDPFGECPFAEGGAVHEGLPVLTVDEEIYRLAPAFVIATVDKFARLAREGEAATLFGYVSRRCDRHGYVHPDYQGCQGERHNARGALPPASVRTVGRLRPPDLIIQDELHLITGALGTTVGLFEMVIDTLTAWATPSGEPCQPLVVASSATVRNAGDQVRALYGRTAALFPPQVLDVSDTYFSTEVPVSQSNPGRRYVGVCASGVRLTAAEIRVAEVLMAGAQLLLDRDGGSADPYLTLVAYFNATRELAGMARFIQDDIQTGLARGRVWSRLPRRSGMAYGSINHAELTSRIASSAITATLDQLAIPFDPRQDTNAARGERVAASREGESAPREGAMPFDAVLATSMLQVGVDVPRLGLMLLVGQPKNTAEYIQASSRVGRSADGPGLVVTLGNWARPRDLAHFEQFRHFHETFYAQVEALSVTPYSITSIERGLEGVLVSAARVASAVDGRDGLSPETGAGRVQAESEFLDALVERLVARALAACGEEEAPLVKGRLASRVGNWEKRRADLLEQGKLLVYERTHKAEYGPLMIGAEATTREAILEGAPFVVPNSMREVQPEINLLVSPKRERLWIRHGEGRPGWTFPAEDE